MPAGSATEGRAQWLLGLTVAHRGLHDTRHGGHWVENGHAAFSAAVRAGFGIECDVRLSADGLPMVFHDATLNRLTHVTGPLSAQPAKVLGRIPLSGTRDTIPRLAQLLEQVAGQVPLLIEVKSDSAAKRETLCEAIAEALTGYTGEHAVMSFDPKVAAWFARHHPETPRGVIFDKRDLQSLYRALHLRQAMRLAKPDFIAVDIRALPNAFVAKHRARGLPVATWTVRSTEQREVALGNADTVIAEGQGIE